MLIRGSCLSGRTVPLTLVLMAATLAGCAQQQAAGPSARLYAVDMAGAARTCNVAPVVPVAGKEMPVAMKVGNDGGWCAIAVNDSGKPFAAGLLVAPQAHGKVSIHSVGNATRIDYTPAPRYAGADSFSVKLIPGDAVLQVAVTVAAP